MTVLVTGAAGRIGSVVVRDLRARGQAVRATDRLAGEGIDIVGDLLDPGCVRDCVAGIDAAVHLAGHPNSRDWAVLDAVNTQATRALLDACGQAGARRILYASSVHAIGLLPADAHVRDHEPPCADSPYGVSKVTGEAMLHYFCAQYGMTGAALRICAFRPEPTNARELRLWISPRDIAALVTAALDAPIVGVETVWGISGNSRAAHAREAWARIGYAPQDDAERFVPALRAAGVDVDAVSEWPRLGGPVAVPQPMPPR